jgi:glycosyltransferase involved in cell wall biosynthesis
LRVLVITSTYPRFPGDGTAPFVDSISRNVAALGHEVHVLVPEHRDWAWTDADGQLSFHRFRYSPVRSWTPWGFSEAMGSAGIKWRLYPLAPVVFASAARAARRLLADGGYDLVHAHWVIPNGPVGRLAAGRTPLVVSLHGSDVAVAERSTAIGRAARWSFDRAAAVTAPSSDLLERARALGARDPLVHVPYGADLDAIAVTSEAGLSRRAAIGVASDDTLIVAIGRLLPVKGFDVLLDALAAALRVDPGLRLALVGDGPERAALEAHIAELGIGDRATLVGAVRHDEVPSFLAAADVVAVPSVQRGGYVDGLPNVALEAMAAGRALVATRVGGLPDLVRDDESGLLLDGGDVEALSTALLGLARDPERRARLGAAARTEIAEHRSWRSVAERFVEVYRQATERRR